MRLITRLWLSIGCRQMLQLIKIGSPIIGNGTGVIQISFVEFLYIRGIAAKEVRVF
jgi:hypothetical protein